MVFDFACRCSNAGTRFEESVMSGLLALLDDVAAIAKVAASSVDDIAGMTAEAGTKTVGIVIDDAAVTPTYVQGFKAERELPIIWKITKGSFFNKLVILLPVAMLMNAFAPWLVTPLLMIGGAYLCFEGAEKVVHAIMPHADPQIEADFAVGDPVHLEEARVKGAIKTDFILSAEIMTISLAAIPAATFWLEAATLALVGIAITVVVYGSVALIVKMDDIGLWMARTARTGFGRAFGRGLVRGMPKFLKVLSVIGTAAMLWVGGSIILHGLEVTHLWAAPYEAIHHFAVAVGEQVQAGRRRFAEWAVTAFADGIAGLLIGLVLIPIVTRVFGLFKKA
jgi:predicted DNA repair protein MutK